MLTSFVLLPVLYFVFTEVDRLRVAAEPATAVLAVQRGGRTLVRLPELEFRLRVEPHCADGRQPESLSVTIADTRTVLRHEQLRELAAIDLTLRVPAGQLAPFALRAFCLEPAAEGDTRLLEAALAAQASLRCSGNDGESIVFAATPLDIRVDCLRSGVVSAPAAD